MKKMLIVIGIGLLVLGGLVVVLKDRKPSLPDSERSANPPATGPAIANPSSSPASSASAASASTNSAATINQFIAKHPTGRGVSHLRRLLSAIQARPAQSEVLAETAARSLEDGSISKEDAVMLGEAAALAEQEGLSPKEMAEFSQKYAMGIGLSKKPMTAPSPQQAPAAPLPSFEGKDQLNYTFTGTAQCAPTPCKNISVSVRVSSGKWVETREGEADAQGRYSFQMPVLSTSNEKVHWRLEAHSKDLRRAELSGERVTTTADHDITVTNTLALNPASQ